MKQEIRGVMYVDEEDLVVLYKDNSFFGKQVFYSTPQQHKGSIGIYVTRYCHLEVIMLKDKCDTCANYKRMEGK